MKDNTCRILNEFCFSCGLNEQALLMTTDDQLQEMTKRDFIVKGFVLRNLITNKGRKVRITGTVVQLKEKRI